MQESDSEDYRIAIVSLKIRRKPGRGAMSCFIVIITILHILVYQNFSLGFLFCFGVGVGVGERS